jgi:hypothetical protein
MALLLLVACTSPPTLRLVSPDADALFAIGEAVFVTVGVTPADALDDMTLRFEVDGVALAGQPSIDDLRAEATLVAEGLAVGEHEITVTGESDDGSDTVTGRFRVFENQAPVVTFLNPTDGGVVLENATFELVVAVDDVDAVPGKSGITLAWTGVGQVVTAPGSLAAPGEVRFVVGPLAPGAWDVGLIATDAFGAVGTGSAAFSTTTGDGDGDGFADAAIGGDDCDDTNPAVNPGATERCNGVDDDCNGLVDDDPADGANWYTDGDGDGYGADASAEFGCDDGTRVSRGGDCDDADPSRSPGAVEECNTGVDEDCDGIVDTDAAESFPLYTDADGDGYGAAAAGEGCSVPDGKSAKSGDCDDTDASVSPGAKEVCDAANTDEDCDGKADDKDSAPTGTTTFYADRDGDGYGDGSVTSARCDAASGWVANTGDCDDDEALAWSGAAEVCEDGVDNDCSGGDGLCAPSGSASLSTADVKLTGGVYATAGSSLDGAGDRDGDGVPDLVVGASLYGTGGTVYLVDGSGLASGALSAHTTVTAEASGDELGASVAGCGDVTGDGRSDVVLGAPSGGSGAGAVYLWSGSKGSGAASTATDEVDGSAGDALGFALDCGADVNDDGKVDVVAGSPGADQAALYDAATLTRFSRLEGGSGAGTSVAFVPDHDGDGIDDVLVGDSQAGKAYLVLGRSGFGNLTLSSGADATFSNEAAGDEAGSAVAGLGDVNGDGYADLAVGAPENDNGGAGAGSAYVIFGQAAPASLGLGSADAALRGADASDYAGSALANAGDANGDGYADVLVGAYYDETAGAGAGAGYLCYGGSAFSGLTLTAADATFLGESTRDSAAETVGWAGDLDGDGTDELLIGAPSENTGGSGAGAVYLIFGGAY